MSDCLQEHRFLFDNMSQGVFFQNADGSLHDVNPAALAIFGTSRDRLAVCPPGHPEWGVIRENGAPLPPEEFPSLVSLRTGERITDFVAGVFNPERQEFVWLQMNSTPMFMGEETLPYRVVVTLHDLSSLRAAMLSVKDSEARFRSFVENSSDVIFILDTSGTFRFVSPSWERHFGYPTDKVLERPFAPVVHPDDVQPCFDYLTQVMATGQAATSPRYRVKCADGSWKLFIANGSRFVDSKGEMLFHGIGRDISEQEHTLALLKASEERFRSIMALSPDIISVITEDGVLAFNSPAAFRIHGYTEEEMVGRNTFELIHPEDRSCVSAVMQKLLSNPSERVSVQYRYLNKDGMYNWMEATASNHISNPHIGGLIVISRDISDRKSTENLLRESEERFRTIIAQSPISMAVVSMEGTIEYINNCAISTFGYQPEDIPHMNDWWRQAYPDPAYREQVIAQWMGLVEKAIAEENRNIERREYQVTCKDGTVKTMLIFGVLIVGKVFVMFEDITELKDAEKELRKNEERYRRFIATANEGISITDRDYNITYVNNRLAEMLGYEPEELIGFPVAQLLPPEEQAGFQIQVEKRKNGIAGRRECGHLRKDGSLVWLLTSSSPIMDEAGLFQGCFAMFTDLTASNEAKKELQKAHDELEVRVKERTAALARANERIKLMTFEMLRAEERERSRIAGELHDQVGQSLILAKMKLDMLASELDSDAESNRAREISRLLDRSLHDIRTLIFAMRPPMLDSAGLKAALERLCASLMDDYNLKIAFSCSLRSLPLAAEKRYSLYMAVRELLMNVIRHADTDFANLEITGEDGRIIIRVIDRGAGFSQSDAANKHTAASGFGLFNVKRRIEQLGGDMVIDSSPDRGTVVALAIPLAENYPGE
jgi:PAS domain S-box-containing protein